MIRIGIFTCSSVAKDLGCRSAFCLDDFRNRKGAFAVYPKDTTLELADIAHCPGCPTATGLEKPVLKIKALAGRNVQTIHLSSCFVALCPFKKRFLYVLETKFPGIEIISGTHGERNSPYGFWTRLKNIRVDPRANAVGAVDRGRTT